MNIPSVKTLSRICDSPAQARKLRKLLEIRNGCKLEAMIAAECPHTQSWIDQCHNSPSLHDMKMNAADELIGTYGVEFIPRGQNAQSPSIEYLNAGDTYAATLMFVRGSFVVGCWGDIVERGHYD